MRLRYIVNLKIKFIYMYIYWIVVLVANDIVLANHAFHDSYKCWRCELAFLDEYCQKCCNASASFHRKR